MISVHPPSQEWQYAIKLKSPILRFCVVAFSLVLFLSWPGLYNVKAQPFNDNYAQAIDISHMSHVFGTTSDATLERREPNYTTRVVEGELTRVEVQRSVWFKYRAPRTGHLAIIMARQADSGVSPYKHAIDVFQGPSSLPANRIVNGPNSEDIGGLNLIRLTFPTQKGDVYYIRVSSVRWNGRFNNAQFSLNLLQFGGAGGATVFPLKRTYGLTNAPLVDGPHDGRLVEGFLPTYIFVNTLPKSISAFLSSNIVDGKISLSSNTVDGRDGKLPGVEVGKLTVPQVKFRQIGTWNYSVDATIRAIGTTRTSFPFVVQRYNAASKELNVLPTRLVMSAPIGTTTIAGLSVRNNGSGIANGCRITTKNRDDDDIPATDLQWKESGSVFGKSFDIPGKQTRRVQLLVRPNFIGNSAKFRVYVICNNAILSSWDDEEDLTLTGTP